MKYKLGRNILSYNMITSCNLVAYDVIVINHSYFKSDVIVPGYIKVVCTSKGMFDASDSISIVLKIVSVKEEEGNGDPIFFLIKNIYKSDKRFGF